MRRPAVAKAFYPAHTIKLQELLRQYLDKVRFKVEPPSQPRAMIVPHAGLSYSGQVAAYAYRLVELHSQQMQRVLILAPSHHFHLQGLVVSDWDFWQTPLGRVDILPEQQELVNWARNSPPYLCCSREVFKSEHAIEMQLIFLQLVAHRSLVLPLLVGDLSDNKIKEAARKIFNEYAHKMDLIIVSSELSCEHTYAVASELDSQSLQAILHHHTEGLTEEGACGFAAIQLLGDLAQHEDWQVQLLNYQNSTDIHLGRESVIGYASLAYF